MMKKILPLFCLVCLAWSLEGCAVVEGAKKLLERVEVCVEKNGVKYCFRLDRDGDGELETHLIVDENKEPHATEDSGDPQ
jgi:hypothetical protein